MLGSSPLSRGIRTVWTVHLTVWGIIPALAGNTILFRNKWVATADHPRSRGEYFTAKASHIAHHGSSPLSRGILMSLHTLPRVGRIIPALAGNTLDKSMAAKASGDHPRSRGEY